MGTKVTLDLKGLSDYIERIVAAGKDVDAITDAALTDAAQIVQTEMQRLVPQPGKSKSGRATGNLRDNIKIDGPNVNGNYHWIEIGVIPSKGLTDANTARYANAVEFGKANMPAQSYIRAGAEKSKGAARKALKERLKEAGIE